MNTKKLKEYIENLFDKDKRFLSLAKLNHFYPNMPDDEYLKKKFKATMGYELNLDNPRTLCEKLQWLKLYDHKPIYTTMVDKYEAKMFVAQKVRGGTRHIIPTLGIWNSFDEIDFNTLPDRFVLKPTHDSGGLIICRDKSNFDYNTSREKLNRSLRNCYFNSSREWPYKNVKPRIIAEPLIDELGKPESLEYKVTCMNGRVAFVTICSGIAHSDFEKRTNDHFDRNFNKQSWYVNYKPAKVTPQKPELWDELIHFSEQLAEDVPYLRVDTYIIDGEILFGEMTFFTWGGFMHFNPPEWDLKLGEMLQLPIEKCLSED